MKELRIMGETVKQQLQYSNLRIKLHHYSLDSPHM